MTFKRLPKPFNHYAIDSETNRVMSCSRTVSHNWNGSISLKHIKASMLKCRAGYFNLYGSNSKRIRKSFAQLAAMLVLVATLTNGYLY